MPRGDNNPNSPKRLHKSYAANTPKALRTRQKVALVRKLMAKGMGYDAAYAEATRQLPPLHTDPADAGWDWGRPGAGGEMCPL